MEALTAAAVAALTVYDMVKGIERGVEIAEVVLLEKTGGKAGLAPLGHSRRPWRGPRGSPCLARLHPCVRPQERRAMA